MGPFCPEGGTLSHETVKDLASTDKKIMFSGEEVGSERHKHHELFNLIPRSTLYSLASSNSQYHFQLTSRESGNIITTTKLNGLITNCSNE